MKKRFVCAVLVFALAVSLAPSALGGGAFGSELPPNMHLKSLGRGAFQQVLPYYEGYAWFCDSVGGARKWGFMDSGGRVVVEPVYDRYWADSFNATLSHPEYRFSDGRALVYLAGSGYGYVDTSGRLVVPLGKYEPAHGVAPFYRDGVAVVARASTRNAQGQLIGGASVLLDRSGKELAAYDRIYAPQDGLARFEHYERDARGEFVYVGDWVQGGVGFIDLTGRVAIPWTAFPFSGNAKPGNFSEGFSVVGGHRIEVIDKAGKPVPAFAGFAGKGYAITGSGDSGTGGFSDGMVAIVRRGTDPMIGEDSQLYGFADRSGRIVVEPKYSWALDFANGFARVAAAVPGAWGWATMDRWGFVDKAGREVLSPSKSKYHSMRPFTEYGFAAAYAYDLTQEDMAGGWGAVRSDGREILPPVYRFIGENNLTVTGEEEFPGGLIRAADYSGRVAYFDGGGNVVIPFGTIIGGSAALNDNFFSGGLIRYGENGKIGYLDLTGSVAIPPIFDGAGYYREGKAVVYAAGAAYLLTVEPDPLDSASGWARPLLREAADKGIVPRALQRDYRGAATRQDFAALVVAAYESATGAPIAGRGSFSDTDDPDVLKAAYIGVVDGVGGGRYDPGAALTRQQAAVMLSRLADALGCPLPDAAPSFSDSGTLPSWAYASVGRVQAAGIMEGTGGNMFSPRAPYSREQAIATVLRLYNMVT
ncbi:MAG: WG repeat-containing protein [Oscillospiraceae bacterium]|nr:WG repeat-containing protein [Oscillospiraceae bacterium]